MKRICTWALLAAVASGCATNLSTLQTARTLEPGQWQVSAGAGVYIPAGQLARALDAASTQAERLARAESGSEALPSDEEQREILETAAALVLYPPGPVSEASLRYGFAKNLDAGARWSSTSLRLDGRWRLFADPDGTDVALILGAERHSFSGLIFDLYKKLQSLSELFDFIELEDPSRWDVEAQIVASKEIRDVFQPYGALKYRAAFYHVPSVLTVEPPGGTPLVTREEIDGTAHFLAGTAGIAIGYRYVWLLFELNLAWVLSETQILGGPAELGGFTVYPAAGLAGRF